MIADELRTVLWPIPQDDDDASWELRREVWDDPRAMIGGSDAGAHLDRMCGAPYPTRFLADCLRGRKLVSLERAVQLITQRAGRAVRPARPRRAARGRARRPRRVRPRDRRRRATPRSSHDLPGDSARLTAGVARASCACCVNGVAIVEDGEATGATPGIVLRSGRDTDTVTAR